MILSLGFFVIDWCGLVHWFPWLIRVRTRKMLAGYLVCGAAAGWWVKRAEH